MAIRFDDKVVLVTGASRGLGNAYARCIAAAGGTVAVNSTGSSDSGARATQEIIDAGGKAFDLPGLVEEGDKLVERVVAECGRIDAIVHNAGALRDKTLRKMTPAQWDAVLDIHLKSAFLLTHAAWPHFEEQGGGRLVFLSSSAGLYGNFGQGNYAAAKMGMYGLCQTIALEGAELNICCNCVAPFGATEMNSRNMPDELKAIIKTDFVAPLIGYLAHPDCAESGGLFEASAGCYKKVRWSRSQGLSVDTHHPISIDDIAAGWDKVVDFEQSEHPRDMRDALRGMYESKLSG